VLAKGIRETRSTRGFTIKQIRRDGTDQFARARMKLSELPIETLNEFVHLECGGRAQRRFRCGSKAERQSADLSFKTTSSKALSPRRAAGALEIKLRSLRFGASMLFSHADAVVPATIL
jgi:hypothetical protein